MVQPQTKPPGRAADLAPVMVSKWDPPLKDSFKLVFQATELEARATLIHLMDRLSELGLPANRAGDIQLALAEALNNVVEHAYGASGYGQISMRAVKDANHLHFCISDSGTPLPGEVLPKALFPDLTGPTGALPEGGFGWCLIHELASSLSYERVDGQNYLKLGFDLHLGT